MNDLKALEPLLRELSTCDSLRARAVADEIRRILPLWGLDRRSFATADQALKRHGLEIGVDWRAEPLKIGETYLLLAGGGGAAVRMRVLGDGSDAFDTEWLAARRPLRVAMEGLANALVAQGKGPLDRLGAAHRLELGGACSPANFNGPSVGLPACITLLSRWLKRPARTDFAGTAEVLADGSLKAVAGLEEKLPALAECWPGVRTVVVACGQKLPPNGVPQCHRIVEVADVLAAAEFFEVVPAGDELPLTRRSDLERRLEDFRHDNDASHDGASWNDLSRMAEAVARSFRWTEPLAVKARGWAALFALHAGAADRATGLLAGLTDAQVAELNPPGQVWFWMTRATATIDFDPAGAVPLAERALQEVANSSARELRDQLLGRAEGTLGRALMHAGRLSEARPHLEIGVESHRVWLEEEQPRSLCYLATCLRLEGQPLAAQTEVQKALDLLARSGDLAEGADLTRRYAYLELGRVLFELNRSDDAIDAFQRACRGAARDHENPRRGGLRGLARAWRRLKQPERAAEALGRCLVAAADATVPDFQRRMAGLAAGEALLDHGSGLPVERPLEELWNVWRGFHPDASDADAIRSRIALAIY